jgi:Asp-tRNA(Asn)/Glu-tRNA(Gln) amidotransferase A subunit family amidase
MEYFVKWWGPVLAAGMDELLFQMNNPELTHPLLRSFVKRADGASAKEFTHTAFTVRQQIHEAFASVLDDHELLTEASAHAGYPAASIPCGFDADQLPIAGKEIAGHRSDASSIGNGFHIDRIQPCF